MPKFHWKGLTRNGATIEGDLEARSKEDVMSRLRAQSITVTTIEEKRTGGEPEDPDRVIASRTQVADPDVRPAAEAKARPGRAVFVAVIFGIAAALIYRQWPHEGAAWVVAGILGGIAALLLVLAAMSDKIVQWARSRNLHQR